MSLVEKKLAEMAQGKLVAQRATRVEALLRAEREGLLKLVSCLDRIGGRDFTVRVDVAGVTLGSFRDDPGEELMAKVALALHVTHNKGLPEPEPQQPKSEAATHVIDWKKWAPT